MEGQSKERKSRDVGFENVKDPTTKRTILEISKAPTDATNFIFWYSKSNAAEWGLTLKSIPKKGDKEGFPSQHTWKITWVHKTEDDGSEILCSANHCKSLAGDIVGEDYFKLAEIYSHYKK